MNLILLFLLPSLIAIITLPFISHRKIATIFSSVLTSATFCLSIPLIIMAYSQSEPIFFMDHWLFCDKISAFFISLNGFVAMTTSFYAISYFNNEDRTTLYPLIYRFYNTFFHLFALSMLMVILSNNIAMMWIGMELATISSVVLIALYQTSVALETAWKYVILCGVGIGLALLGTVIIYFAAYPVMNSQDALLWTSLIKHAHQLSPLLLSIAFIFLIVGYGTKAGFFPLHNWLPDAYTESPSPVSALLAGLLINVALLALLRVKLIMQQTTLASLTSHLLIIFGVVNILYASLSLLRQRQLKRLFAYSSIEHVGLISIALGIGSPLAYFAALFHIMLHSLSKSAAFFACGGIIQRFHTQTMSQLKGLCSTIPATGWCLLLCGFALLGLPPFGLFWSELFIILATFQTHPWLLIPILLGLSIAFIAFISKIQRLAFSSHPVAYQPLKDTKQLIWPAWLHVLIVIAAGIWIPYAFIEPVVHLLVLGN